MSAAHGLALRCQLLAVLTASAAAWTASCFPARPCPAHRLRSREKSVASNLHCIDLHTLLSDLPLRSESSRPPLPSRLSRAAAASRRAAAPRIFVCSSGWCLQSCLEPSQPRALHLQRASSPATAAAAAASLRVCCVSRARAQRCAALSAPLLRSSRGSLLPPLHSLPAPCPVMS